MNCPARSCARAIPRSRSLLKSLSPRKDQERLGLHFSDNLKRAGIVAQMRMVDAVQYDRRRLTFDFDMIQNRWDQSLSPGNEQVFYWSNAAAGEDGTRNYMGAKNPAIDAMIAALLRAQDRPSFVAAVRALDRVLLSGFYVIPLYPSARAMGGALGCDPAPDQDAALGIPAGTWWREPGK